MACGKQNKFSVAVTANGKTYALNGTAKTHEGWPGLEPIWAMNLDISGTRINVGDLLDYAAEKCAER